MLTIFNNQKQFNDAPIETECFVHRYEESLDQVHNLMKEFNLLMLD